MIYTSVLASLRVAEHYSYTVRLDAARGNEVNFVQIHVEVLSDLFETIVGASGHHCDGMVAAIINLTKENMPA